VTYAPQYVGGVFNPLLLQWTLDGNKPAPIGAGMTLELWFQSVQTPGKKFKGAGTFSNVVVPSSGPSTCQDNWATSDLAVADVYLVQAKAYPTGSPLNPFYSDVYEIPVLQGPAP
jgi:hypothetical protein